MRPQLLVGAGPALRAATAGDHRGPRRSRGIGYGRSDWSIANFAQDVEAVLAEEDVTDVTLVGHSLGGPVVLDAAIATQGCAAAVVGGDTFSDGWRQPSFSERLEGIEDDYAGFVGRQRHAMFVVASTPALVDRIMAAMALQPVTSGIGAMRGLAAWAATRFMQALGALRVPLGLVATSDKLDGLNKL